MAAVDDAGERFGAFWVCEDGREHEAAARAILERLVDSGERFRHLKEGQANILVLMRAGQKSKAGRSILGTIALPRFQGANGDVAGWLLSVFMGGRYPDYILILDAQWWETAAPLQREALVFHEICHTRHEKDADGELKYTEDGRPVFGIQGHDLEEFRDVVAQYGAWLDDVGLFADALRAGGVL